MSSVAPVATLPSTHRVSLIAKFAQKFSIDEDKLITTLKATAFKVKDKEVTNEQMTALLIVADQYNLNPFTKEIFAFPDAKSNGIVAVVSVDGWSRIINEHGALDGIEFRYSDKKVTMKGAKECPEWCEVVIKRKDRGQPIVVREYLDEVYRDLSYTNPWQTHTKRFLRHKTLIQGARIAFGFGGIYDEDEAERILDGNSIEGAVTSKTIEVEQPKAKESAAPAATGEESRSDRTASPNGGAAPDAVGGQPMKPSQVNIIKAKLASNGLTEIDLEAKFGKSLEPKPGKEQFKFEDFNDVQAWISESAKT